VRVLIGLDDTDNLESRGTGHLARQLAAWLAGQNLASPFGITRHQLLVSPLIPYTSHNSSACLEAEVAPDGLERLAAACSEYVARESAPGADAGLCLAPWERIGEPARLFGESAKREVLEMDRALGLAQETGLFLEGLSGTRGGVIGALAAVGLRAGGEDGRFLWLPGLRELSGQAPLEQLRAVGIEAVLTLEGNPVQEPVEVGDWPRPLLKGGRAILLVEEVRVDGKSIWRTLPKEVVKQLSD
jgi:hypothetical protein